MQLLGSARIAWLCTVAILAMTSTALGQPYPSRPIRIVVAYPPGGGADILARSLGQKLTETWGQQVIVDNRPGGGANIGAEVAARATADGYTLFEAALAHSVNVSLYSKLHYDITRDFAPVIFTATVPGVLVVPPSLPVHSTREFLEYAKARPGQLNYASTGSGGPQHLGMELLKTLAGVTLIHVPYKGAAPALSDLVAGQVQAMLGNMISTLPHMHAGRLRALAVTSVKRSQTVPDLPTIAESGVPGFESGSWFGIMAPAGTPRPIIDKLNAEVNRILALPEMGKRLGASGAELVGGTPEGFSRYVRNEIDKWAKVVKFAKMRVE